MLRWTIALAVPAVLARRCGAGERADAQCCALRGGPPEAHARRAEGEAVSQTAQTSTTLVQPGVTVKGLSRVKKRRIVGRSRLTL